MQQHINSMEVLAATISWHTRKSIPYLFAVDFEMNEAYFTDYPQQQQEILFRTPLMTNMAAAMHIEKSVALTAQPMSFEDYKKGFNIVHQGLLYGNSYLTNYTTRTPIDCCLSIREIAMSSTAPFVLCIPNKFVCFSPERFVQIKDGFVTTHPMKGTIDAALPNAEQRLLADPKELAEHITVVDLLRNDIGIIADEVEVSRFRYLSRIETQHGAILQMSSAITGRLPSNAMSHLGELLLRLLPAGSICGAPKESTLKLIAEAENHSRGFYSGIFGVFDGQSFDSAVMIRFIEEDTHQQLYFHSGGGITVNSHAETEYNEMIQKIYLSLA